MKRIYTILISLIVLALNCNAQQRFFTNYRLNIDSGKSLTTKVPKATKCAASIEINSYYIRVYTKAYGNITRRFNNYEVRDFEHYKQIILYDKNALVGTINHDKGNNFRSLVLFNTNGSITIYVKRIE